MSSRLVPGASSRPITGEGVFSFQSSWMGPGAPVAPNAPETQGRGFDFPVGYNQRQTVKDEGVTFADLRSLADGYDLLRLAIETRKDQMEGMLWTIKGRDGKAGGRKAKAITERLACPDGEHTWNQWSRMLWEDLLVLDAPCIYPRRTKGGEIFSLDVVAGDTIRRVLDETGRTPMEGPAYQQILKGIVASEFTREELIYMPRNVRANRVYGYSPTEQVIATVNIALRRQLTQLSFYADGSTPNMLFGVPPEWNARQIAEFQSWWDSNFSGNAAQQARARFIPGGVTLIDTKAQALKDAYDEWLARIVCYAFSLSPLALIQQMNRATAETAQETAQLEGLRPLQNWWKGLMDRILRDVFHEPSLEFCWESEQELDPEAQARIHSIYIQGGVLSVDEVRDTLGLEHEERKEEPVEVAEPGEDVVPSLAPAETSATVQDTALNGAQVASLLQIVQMATDGVIPKGTAQAVIAASFPALSPEAIAAILDTIRVEEPAPEPPPPTEAIGVRPPETQAGEAEPDPEKVAKARPKSLNRRRQAVLRAERQLKAAVKALFRRSALDLAAQIEDAIAERFGKAEGAITPDDIDWIVARLNLEGWNALEPQAQKLLERIARDGGAAGLEQIGVARSQAEAVAMLNQVNERALEWSRERSADLVTRIGDTTRDRLRSDIREAIEQGLGTDELAAALSEAYSFSDARAEVIARTELAFADVQGNVLAYEASGEVEALEWIVSSEGGCPICEANTGAVVALGGTFPSGDAMPPAHPNCICDVVPVLKNKEER